MTALSKRSTTPALHSGRSSPVILSDHRRLSKSCLLGIVAAGTLWSCSVAAQTSPDLATIVVTAPGGHIDVDDAIAIDATDLRRSGRADVLGSLARTVPGLSLSDAQNNPWQPNLVYRGFVASPLQGNAQGLAVYLDGGRFNQPFGDTVDFDLLPEAAIESLTIKDASPVYGLNALGGAIVVATRTGRTSPGVNVSLAGGNYGRQEASAEAGWNHDGFSAYVALQARHEDGWRYHSPSTLYNGFGDIGWDGTDAGVHLKIVAADTDLTGNGSSPVELLAVDRRAVFTYPDNTRNRFGRVSLHPWARLSDTTRVEASLYLQRLRQRTVNGDAADIEGCEEPDAAGLLCLDGDEETILSGTDGKPIVDTLDGGRYGLLNRSQTRTDAGGILVQFVDRRAFGSGENELILGASYDQSHTRFTSSSELGELTADRSVEGLGTTVDQPDGSIAPVGLVARTRYTGIFLADRLPLLPGLTAEIGLRWNDAKVELDDQIGTALNGDHRFRRLNPGIELDYKVSDNLSLRAGYAETNRAPTPAELSCADEAAPCSLTNFFVGDPPLNQVVTKTWEAGASGQHKAGGWTLDWLLSAYRAANHDDILFVASDIAGRAYFRNLGTTRRQGIEANLTARSGPWTLRAGYALTDATFRTALVLNSPDNPGADAAGQIFVAPGDRLPGIPRHRGVVSTDYTGRGFSLGGDLQAQSGQRLQGDESGLQPPTSGFALVNLRGSVAIVRSLTLFGELTNAFNKKYETFGTFSQTDEVTLAEAPGASNPRSLGPGSPRRWTAGIRARF